MLKDGCGEWSPASHCSKDAFAAPIIDARGVSARTGTPAPSALESPPGSFSEHRLSLKDAHRRRGLAVGAVARTRRFPAPPVRCGGERQKHYGARGDRGPDLG